jgi:hypothetical protein
MKRCAVCLRVLPIEQFSPHASMRDRRSPDCKSGNSAAKRARKGKPPSAPD